MINMEQYYLNTLIFFFKSQMEIGYKAIEQVLAIIDHNAIPDTRKRKAIFQVLHYYGLNEVGYKGGRFGLGDKEPLSKSISKNIHDIPILTHTYILTLLNGTLELSVPLN
jgi:hypothetical protein